MSPEERSRIEHVVRNIIKHDPHNPSISQVTNRQASALLETIDLLVNADDTEEVEQLRAKLSAAEGALAGYRKLERMDRVAFIRQAFLAIVAASGDGAGDVSYDDDTVWESARRAWDTKPEDC